MDGPGETLIRVVLYALLGTVGLAAALFLFFTLFGLVWRALRNIVRFVGAEIGDAVRLIGVVIAAPVFALLVVLNIVIGRWSASGHFGRAFGGEVRAGTGCVYRLLLANPLRLFGLAGVLEGVEQRVPQAMAGAPGKDRPSARRVGMFDGYTIVGSLPGGGSGGKLYIAQPDEIKRAALSRRGAGDVDRVVIKVFSQKDGSTLDQILRESRALEAARRIGLVLEHESDAERFYYVMRYVPGESLGVLTPRMHAACPPGGLDDRRLREALGYASDLVGSLHVYHQGGLWHKDVKPDNIIVDRPGTDHARAHLVDLGLVTPMRSAMTLTTHGTEYFRDPELVRQALRGVKVHQIDGARFDVYSAGAVLFSVIENSFPAHGGLSQITRRCPEALRWVIRRAMAEYDQRYPTAAAFLGDLEAIRAAADPFALKPADLPSMSGRAWEPAPAPDPVRVAHAGTPVPPAAPGVAPRLSIADWWTGRYTPEGAQPPAPPAPPRAARAAGPRLPAAEQVSQARQRAHLRRQRAHERIARRRAQSPGRRNPSGTRSGIAGALAAALLLLAAVVGLALLMRDRGVSGVELVHNRAITDEWVRSLPRLERTYLVVSDLGHPLDPALDAEIDAGLAALASRGATFVGDLIEGGDIEEGIALVARARADRGAAPIESGELRGRLKGLLTAEPDLGGVVWVAPPPAGAQGVQVAVVSGRSYAYRTVDSREAGVGLVDTVLELVGKD